MQLSKKKAVGKQPNSFLTFKSLQMPYKNCPTAYGLALLRRGRIYGWNASAYQEVADVLEHDFPLGSLIWQSYADRLKRLG